MGGAGREGVHWTKLGAGLVIELAYTGAGREYTGVHWTKLVYTSIEHTGHYSQYRREENGSQNCTICGQYSSELLPGESFGIFYKIEFY